MPLRPDARKVDIAARRLRNQRLTGRPFVGPEDAVRWFGAVQSQDYAAAAWGIGQRVLRGTAAVVDDAYAAGRILRTHMMRPTWHFVAPEDIRWIMALTSARVHAVSAGRYRELEIDDDVYRRSRRVMARALSGGHRTRAELGAALNGGGIAASGQRLAYIIMRAELDAMICSGAMRGKQHTYALLDERAPAAARLSRGDALGRLAERYFASHGPAQARDFAWWSGLTIADATAAALAVDATLVRHEIDGVTYWEGASPAARTRVPLVHLLPNYDEHVVAYRDHGPSLDPALPEDGALLASVFARHLVVRRGLVIGGWRTLPGDPASIEARVLVPIDRADRDAIREAADRYGRFIGRQVTLTLSGP